VNPAIIAGVLLVLLGLAYQFGWARSRHRRRVWRPPRASRSIRARNITAPYVAIWTLVPTVLIVILWAWFGDGIHQLQFHLANPP
jgi:phosphate transport system permease protein